MFTQFQRVDSTEELNQLFADNEWTISAHDITVIALRGDCYSVGVETEICYN